MIQIRSINNVARYERKTLLRSWFFRIFVAIALFYMIMFNIFFFAHDQQSNWMFRALESFMPYINTLFINVAQAVVAVFLASDFLKQDKKLDTAEVIYTRPISNIEYVVGKTWGIISVFMGLTFFFMLITAIFNFVIKDVGFDPMSYVMYPLLIALPTLVYILGISFILMIVVKNQAVTFLILLGYVALTLFYFQDKYFGIFDYIGFNFSMGYSEMIGFVEPQLVFMQRGFYFFLGISFIFATVRWINRLPQSPLWNQLNLLFFVITFLIGSGMGVMYLQEKMSITESRDEFRQLNDQWEYLPNVKITSNALDVTHTNSHVSVVSDMWVKSKTGLPVDTFILTLNPGFKIKSFESSNHGISYKRQGHLLIVTPDVPFAKDDSLNIKLAYNGTIDTKVCYLDVLDDDLINRRHIGPIGIENMYGLIRSDYVLMTPETLWYPRAGVTFNMNNFLTSVPGFTSFSLTVKTKKGLTAISQGKVMQNNSTWTFSNAQDLNALSLIIGDYEKKSITVDSLDIHLYHAPGHDYYTSYFPNLKDTLEEVIKDRINDYESNTLDLYLAFDRINIVEVPVQFQVFDRVLNAPYETVQPEMFLFPEKGASLSSADFKRRLYYENRRNTERSGGGKRPIEIEADVFQDFLRQTFLTTASSSGFSRDASGRPQRNSSSSQFRIDGASFGSNPLSAFPMYYDFTTAFESDEYPMFNSIVSTYLQQGFSISTFQQFTGGMGDVEKANLALKMNSLEDMIENKAQRDLLPKIISQKGSFLINGLKHEVGIYDFDDFLYYYIEDHAFQTIALDSVANALYKDYEVDMYSFLESLNTKGSIPKFLMSSATFFESRDEYGPIYIVRFKMTNNGDVKGLVNVSFRMGGGFGGGGENEERILSFEAGETKEVQLVLFEQPRLMTVNTLVSENIPSSFSVFLRNATRLGKGTFEEYENIVSVPVMLESESELVIDNEHEGFSVHVETNESKLKKYLEDRKEEEEIGYGSVSGRYTPNRWKPVAHTAFYGESVRSAWYVRGGNGNSYVTWQAPLKDKGFYDIYTYIPVSAMLGRSGGDRGRGSGQGGQRDGQSGDRGRGGGGGPSFADGGTDYHYFIYHGIEKEEVEYVLSNEQLEGWNKLGTFFLEDDSIKIQLTNQSSGNRVFADAIKLVKRENQ